MEVSEPVKPSRTVKVGVSMEESLHARAYARAKRERRSFSAHVQYLLEQDLEGTQKPQDGDREVQP